MEHKTIEGTLQLTSGQLELLLSMLEVEKLPGIGGKRFLENRKEHEAATQQLTKDGWLLPTEKGQQSINPGLIRVVLNMAHARHIIITNITKQGRSQGIVQYFGKEFVVEMANEPAGHRLTILESQDIALSRVSHYAEMPSDELENPQSVILNKQESEQLTTGRRGKAEDSQLLQTLILALNNPVANGDIVLLKNRWEDGYASSIYQFVVGRSSSWGISSVDQDHMKYQLIGEPELTDTLLDFLNQSD